MKLTTLIAVPLLLMTQSINFVVTHKNGETTTIKTENIESISFSENEPVTPPNGDPETPGNDDPSTPGNDDPSTNPGNEDPVTPPEEEKIALQTPEVTVTETGNGTAIAKWIAVDEASFYKHQLDDQAPITERLTEITLSKMDAGVHTLKVTAIPSDRESFTDSEPAVITFTIVDGFDGNTCS